MMLMQPRPMLLLLSMCVGGRGRDFYILYILE